MGSLDKIKRLVKSLGMVNSAVGFNQQPEVRKELGKLVQERTNCAKSPLIRKKKKMGCSIVRCQVINGYSELMRDVFGDSGVGARSAVGMMLPHDIATEIEAIWELHDDA